jgi:Holliday junction resolvasome RuvABC endonuclease subunit
MVIIGRLLQILEDWGPTMIVTPPQVKQQLGLSGIAKKEHVEPAVRHLLTNPPEEFDATADREAIYDACAIAYAGRFLWKPETGRG